MDRDGRPADLRFEFAHTMAAPGDGRRALTGFLTDPDDPLTADVVLAAAELITNVIRHTGSGGVLQAWDPKPDVPLRLEVADSEPRSPQVVQDVGVAGGFGLRIVNTLADAWSVIPTETGKVVWAEFDRSKHKSWQGQELCRLPPLILAFASTLSWPNYAIRPAWSYRLNSDFGVTPTANVLLVAEHPELRRHLNHPWGVDDSVATTAGDLFRQIGYDERLYKPASETNLLSSV